MIRGIRERGIFRGKEHRGNKEPFSSIVNSMLPFLEAPLKRTRKEAQDYLLIHPECTLVQEGCPKKREIQKRFKIS